QVFEAGDPGALVRVLVVHQLDLHQREVVLVFDRQPDRAFHHQSRAQTHTADLRRRDVNVFGAGEVVVRLAAEEPVAVGQHFQGARPADDFAALDLPADDANDQLGAAHTGVFADAFLLRQREEFGHRHAVQVVEPRTDRTGAFRAVVPFGAVDPFD